MDTKKQYKIALFGLSDNERQVINSVVSLSSSRNLSYQVVESGSQDADVVIIDADDPAAVASWRDSIYSQTRYPKMLVSQDSSLSNSKAPYLFRPLKAAKLLEQLDLVVIKSLRGGKDGVSPEQLKVRKRRDDVKRNQAGLVVGSEYKALLIDEDVVNRRRLEGLLETVGVKLDLLETGSQSIEVLKNYKYNIIFISSDLPDMTGYQLCKTLKAIDGVSYIPMILVKQKAKALDLVRNTMAGNDGSLTKPVEKEALYDYLRKFLSERRAPR